MSRIITSFVTTSIAFGLLWFLAGCGTADGLQPDEDGVTLEPVGGSEVSGTAAFQQIEGGVEIELEVRGLPEPETIYLSHIHPGACDDEHEHEGDAGHHDHHAPDDIEHPLSPVRSDSEGNGNSTTILWDVGVEELLSGDPKHVNVHAAGPGMQKPLACADLNE